MEKCGMKLGRFTKTPAERKRYAIDYSQWLDSGETVVSKVFAVSPTGALQVDASSISSDGKTVVFFVYGGNSGVTYTVDIKTTTSVGQTKEDVVYFAVKDL
jgi:hypothetical protein